MDKLNSFNEMLTAWGGGAFTTIIGALAGRFMWHGNEARKGNRKFFRRELLWEFPVAVGMALIDEGVASYLGMSQPASTGLIAALAYLGPRGTEVLFQRWFSKKFG